MSPSPDVIIIGGGIEGLSTAWALAQRGVRDVLVLERGTLCSGGTAKSSGVVRCHYGVPSLAAMAWNGLQIFENAQDLLGQDVGFQQTGYVVGVGPENVAALEANLAMHHQIGIDVQTISHDDVQALWPWADLTDFAAFAYEPRGGYGDAYQTGQAFAHAARRLGVSIRQDTPVTGITLGPSGHAVGVVAAGEHIHAGSIVVAAGPWSVPLCAPLGLHLPIRAQREQILLIDPGEPIRDAPVFSDLVNLQYIRTERSGELLVGNSDHASPEFADPDHYSNQADEAHIAGTVDKLDSRLPKLPAPALSSSYAGCYDVTPDYNPILSATPIQDLYICAGFSGHGYKISPAVGTLMADIVTRRAGTDPHIRADDFRLERFDQHQPLRSPHPYTGAGQMR
ncbi:FAD-binding oxidoreductase [Actinomadura sp. 7K507]|uniref:NAD(P)/FAD-dependent oxidoreductase n=1 Tax=Actinomadura sp. 7K507 TaxID=2530365 RepID=UPI001048418F|nr:FAD-binding oxidoreductase [Actinomadura sp. 7K507]TDC80532.1 FAD-binding oxidoreductase [Actinomadura sp. 7K507]